ncbi:MAG: hypothetical protein P0Y65_09835 [Candidatus Devosia phytovorans]|uniref:Porin n=1 Tax=Candidatus Devosia phytovorans TaxID=3121372 RepID=A0AAJ6B2J4_9HYPH|nr:hypothetical protein [Devosia sp.]WEK06519.1 MAG: hypothetical protein P0Y65_09835 [Devosia sp.]
MKLKSLILGSIAAAGLSTAGFAADLGVLTSLDVCDELGLSGLTISSDTNCLQISGGITYQFNWGNYNESEVIAGTATDTVSADEDSEFAGISNNDYESRIQSWLKFVGTQGSDFGPASAVIKIKHDDRVRTRNGGFGSLGSEALSTDDGVIQRETGNAIVIDEAYVQVGDTTVLTAGKRGSIFNEGDDEPFNFTGLFGAEIADAGVLNDEAVDTIAPERGGEVIQLWTNIGEGLIAKIGLENLGGDGPTLLDAQRQGTLVGVLDYAGSGITAHISGALGGILDGAQNGGDTYIIHTGATATFDNFKVRAAGSFGGFYDEGSVEGWGNYWNALISGEANFDMFKIALSAEAVNVSTDADVDADTDFGFGGSVGATVAEGIELNLGGRYFNDGTDGVADGYQVALQLIAAVTETIKVTGEIGVYGHGADEAPAATIRNGGESYSDFYASAELGWNPGGGFSSSLGAKVQENGAYKVTFKAAKSFQ